MTYVITGFNGQEHKLTPGEIYEKLLERIDQYDNWFCSYRELGLVCEVEGFPGVSKKAIAIECIKHETNSLLMSIWDQNFSENQLFEGDDNTWLSYFFNYLVAQGDLDNDVIKHLHNFVEAIVLSVVHWTNEDYALNSDEILWSNNYERFITEDLWALVFGQGIDVDSVLVYLERNYLEQLFAIVRPGTIPEEDLTSVQLEDELADVEHQYGTDFMWSVARRVEEAKLEYTINDVVRQNTEQEEKIDIAAYNLIADILPMQTSNAKNIEIFDNFITELPKGW